MTIFLKEVLLYKWGNQGSKRWNDLPKDAIQISDSQYWIQVFDSKSSAFSLEEEKREVSALVIPS